MEIAVVPTEASGYVDDLVPAIVQQLAVGMLISREHVEQELDMCLRTIRTFWQMEPDQVLRASGAISARCTELSVHLHRLEGKREWKQIRTMQVDRILAEVDRQFRINSRLIEVRRQDIAMER